MWSVGGIFNLMNSSQLNLSTLININELLSAIDKSPTPPGKTNALILTSTKLDSWTLM